MLIAVPVRAAFALALALVLSACTIQLVPDYDQALVDGLTDANTQTLTLFAKLQDGSPQKDFAKYQDNYAELIGQFDALQLRARSRYVPPLAMRLGKLKAFSEVCGTETDPIECLNTSPAAMDTVVSTLEELRKEHREDVDGLKGGSVAIFKGQYEIALDQAMTVETALKR